MNTTFKPERQKNSNSYNLKTTKRKPIMTNFLQELFTTYWPSWAVPQTTARAANPSVILGRLIKIVRLCFVA